LVVTTKGAPALVLEVNGISPTGYLRRVGRTSLKLEIRAVLSVLGPLPKKELLGLEEVPTAVLGDLIELIDGSLMALPAIERT